MYEKTESLYSLVESGSLTDALHLFEKMPQRGAFAWNVIIRGLVDAGFFDEAIHYYYRMQFEGTKPDYFTYPFVIKACAGLLSLNHGQKAHARLTKCGLGVDVYICNSLIAMYAKLGFVECAERLFEEMVFRDLVSWNSMISAYVSNGDGCRALMYFCSMQASGMVPDRFSIIGALGACSLECFLEKGKEIHCQVMKLGLDMDVMVQTAIVDMYGKCLEVKYAERYFNGIVHKIIAAWNAMIGSYVVNDLQHESLACLKKMQDDDKLVPDVITTINLLPACAQLGALQQGRSIHGFAVRQGFVSHPVLETALVDMYGKCRRLSLAKILFSQMTSKTSVSWNVMAAAYVQNGCYKEALQLFQSFLKADMEPDAFLITSILSAYAEFALQRECEQIHAYIAKSGFVLSTSVSNAIVHMYATCGDLISARKVFDSISHKDVVSWNTIIMAYALHCFGKDAVELCKEMQEKNIQPNGSTFVSLLSSCSIAGMVDEGWKYFNLMKREYGIDPGIEHYGCMLDLLGRSGNLDLALRFIEEMPLVPTSRIWGSLLAASRNRKSTEFAEYAAKHILSLDQDNTGCYVLLSNLYAKLERWEDVERITSIMSKEGIERTVGCSTIEIDSKVQRFFNQDRSHKEINKIYDALDVISTKIGEDNYVHTLAKFSPTKVAKKRENSPELHSVRLAITSGLISTTIGRAIIVRKNIRLCEDCHVVAKKISEITKREIVVGDSKIFHHFKDGKCSCGDYW